jgi:hypothetical protein
MIYRVKQEFKLTGDPPTQAATDRLLERLRAAAPEAEAAVEIGVGRFQVALTFQAPDPDAAADLARTTTGAVLAARAVRVEAEPASGSSPGSAASPHAACSGPS